MERQTTSGAQQQPPSQQQNPQQPPNQPASRNIKNLSIKEFFTTRLMRARSFEGGNNSPKDETSNWFDEFKARMTKKSQAAKEKVSIANEDSINDDSMESSDHGASSTIRVTKHRNKRNRDSSDLSQQNQTKDSNCDKSESIRASEDISQFLTEDDETRLTSSVFIEDANLRASCIKDTSKHGNISRNSVGGHLKFAKSPTQRISSVESPDFDAASINTIFNRRDSRYERISRKSSYRLFFSKIVSFIPQVILYLIPFDYNLPWKLLTLVNFTFGIIVISLTYNRGANVTIFSFFNGFISGLFIATICFIILILSLLCKVLPKTQSRESSFVSRDTTNLLNDGQPLRTNKVKQSSSVDDAECSTFNDNTESGANSDQTSTITSASPNYKQKVDDFSTFEVLDIGGLKGSNQTEQTDGLLDDDDYKSWMIEFVGDYELRNKSEFKLKLIFVKLENRILYLCKPKNNHEAESASFPVFVQQRIYNLATVTKFSANLLLPKNVHNRQKWVWSKKYPIKLEFYCDNIKTISGTSNKLQSHEQSSGSIQLTLFAKSCREKEEWFRRFKRIVEENRMAFSQKRCSIQSDLSNSEINANLLNSSIRIYRGRSPSPTPKTDSGVQTSKSSHLLHDSRRTGADKTKPTDEAGLIRTKSCEILTDVERQSLDGSINDEQLDRCEFGMYNLESFVNSSARDDSTLTKESAEIYSQSIEYSNFLESQPNLIYRDYIERVIESGTEATSTSDWFNALTGRIFFDVFSHNYWSVWFKRKIQRKLYRIRLPYFMETLTLTTIDLGTNAPQFLNVVSHNFDSFGLSIDFDMAYSGGLTMTFETKLNLLKIKNGNSSATSTNANGGCGSNVSSFSNNPTGCSSASQSTTNQGPNVGEKDRASLSSVNSGSKSQANNFEKTIPSQTGENVMHSKDNSDSTSSESGAGNRISCQSSSGSLRNSGGSSDSCDSDSDSSSKSSSDEEENIDEISDWDDYGAEKTRQSFVRFVDKIASSRYFQHATENRYIKKKLQDISNCPLVLIVKIESLSGVLTLNIPPPQTDRVWYGFKPNPELTLKALPKMGDREVNLSHVTDWIEKKLADEFRKILVIPNMEDIVLPVLKSDHLLYVATTR